MNNLIVYGNILYSVAPGEVKEYKNHYLFTKNGKVMGIYKDIKDIPYSFRSDEILSYPDKLIIPTFVDLHLHAPQYALCGFQLDLELLDWLNRYTFPEESKYKDMDYAREHYDLFVDELKHSLTGYFSMFGSIHTDADLYLMDKLEESGLISYVGKVNMDRNSPDYLIETTEESMEETKRFVNRAKEYKNTKPIITPRFIPSCTDELMKFLGDYAKKNNLPIQSHLDENLSEIAWVKELVPNSKSYTDAYNMFNTLNDKTIMAHCVWNNDEELELIKKNKAFIAHCPTSNNNIASGIAPVRKYLNMGLNVGLGSDVAGGHTLDMMEILNNVVLVSKLYWRLIDNNLKPLSFKEAFYLATLGGGKYFGKVGSFNKGYEASFLVLDDSKLEQSYHLDTLIERLERMSYTKNYKLLFKFVRGKEIL